MAVRFLLRAIGAMNRNGSNLASYLLFEARFCRALIDLGYQDTMARRDGDAGIFGARGLNSIAPAPLATAAPASRRHEPGNPVPGPVRVPEEAVGARWAAAAGRWPPLLDPNEIEKRIADLKSVETWLNMNLNVLRMTIQGLEMQKATLAAFQSMQPKPVRSRGPMRRPQARRRRRRPPPSAADAWWSLLQQMQNPPPAPKPDAKPEKKGK